MVNENIVVSSFGVRNWNEYGDIIARVSNASVLIQARFLDRLNDLFTAEWREIASSSTWTGTYLASINGRVEREGAPRLILGFDPQGDQANRLDIYWRVLERGAEPNPRIPESTLISWASQVFGRPEIGLAVVANNRAMFSGINPNPILSQLFIFDESLVPIGLTDLSRSLVVKAMEAFQEGIKEVIRHRGIGGRFTRAGEGIAESGLVRRGPTGFLPV